MKKQILLFTLILFMGLTYAQNLTNAGFDNWTTGVPDGWTLDTQGTDCTFSEVAGETNSALRCAVTNNGSGVDGAFNQTVLDIVAGQNYDFQVRVKGTSVVASALRFWCQWQDVNNANLASTNVQPSLYYSTTTSWATYSILQATAPTLAVKVKWVIRLYGLQTTDFDNILSPLPVELTSFSASVQNKTVNLTWHTATEVNNYGFEVERISNEELGIRNWNKVGFVNGAGNSNSPKEYSFTDKSAASGKYLYRLKQLDNDGQYSYSKEVEVDLGSPTAFALEQNYPNPFNPTTSIQYSVVRSQNVTIKVFNVLGKEVAVLVNEKQEPGTYTVEFSTANLASGTYIYRMQAGEFVQTKKMIVLK